MFYIYPEKNLRTFPGTVRGTDEWDDTYKIRVAVEKSINHFKDSFCVADRKTRNALTLKADLYLAGITQLVTVLLADSIHQHKYKSKTVDFCIAVFKCMIQSSAYLFI